MLPAIIAFLPLAIKLFGLFVKTPEEKRADLAERLTEYIDDVLGALAKTKENPGDTSDLERAINRRR